MKKIVLICLICLGFSGIAFSAPTKETVLSLLQGRHWTLEAATFENLGSDTETILIEIAGDSTLMNFMRFRALQALTLFSSEEVATFLESVTRNAFAPLARRGFEAFSAGFSRTHSERVQQAAMRLVNHENVSIKISAARTLKTLNDSEFQRFIRNEPEAWVRKAAQE